MHVYIGSNHINTSIKFKEIMASQPPIRSSLPIDPLYWDSMWNYCHIIWDKSLFKSDRCEITLQQ